MLSVSPIVPERPPASLGKHSSSVTASDPPAYIQYFLFGLEESHINLGIQCYGVTLSSPYRKDTKIQRRQDISSMSQLVAAILGEGLSVPIAT